MNKTEFIRSILCTTWAVSCLLSSTSFAHVEKGNMPDGVAQTEYQILLEFKPNNTKVRYSLAMIYFRQQKYQKAKNELEKVLKIDPENFHGYEGLGMVLTEQKQFEQAISQFKTAIVIQPNDDMVYYYLGLAYERSGKFSNSEEAYRAALKNMAGSPDGHAGGKEEKEVQEALIRVQKKIKHQ